MPSTPLSVSEAITATASPPSRRAAAALGRGSKAPRMGAISERSLRPSIAPNARSYQSSRAHVPHRPSRSTASSPHSQRGKHSHRNGAKIPALHDMSIVQGVTTGSFRKSEQFVVPQSSSTPSSAQLARAETSHVQEAPSASTRSAGKAASRRTTPPKRRCWFCCGRSTVKL